ncbi:MAG: DNA mismatch repair protein, partial [Flavobacterium sp.]|nr:DNA mismatch repair protein [Flavobacterium sp.]
FGKNSLFQNLNRTSTFIGKKMLADQLLNILPNAAILENQIAITELATQFLWRQQFMAVSKITQDSKEYYETLIKWSRRASKRIPKFYEIISIVSPLILLGCAITFLITNNTVFLNYIPLLFLFNLFIIRSFLKQIKAEINDAENIDKIIKQYSLILQKIEKQTFVAGRLLYLQQNLHFKDKKASQHLKKLSFLFSQMDVFFNAFATILFNGLFLFHLHILKRLADWKKENASELESWLEAIGEFEMLNSLANLSYNNCDFAFPELNSNFEISFANISHPLLNSQSRVQNDVTFQPQSFTILTGSNMSGKSTFLRSLGINMVLAGIGSVVCASTASIHPLPILVSMRLSDSLADNESYFYAEIKRLKQIMNCLEKERSFVLLDEILRGTNSDDKRNGTVEVIKKMIQKKAIGAIATHDIEVCLTTNTYPQQLVNRCFEAQIIDNDLYFDFKLRDGVCKNRSASFLMQKMGVI